MIEVVLKYISEYDVDEETETEGATELSCFKIRIYYELIEAILYFLTHHKQPFNAKD